MTIVVTSRSNSYKLSSELTEPHIWISVNDVGTEENPLFENNNRLNRLNLWFDDKGFPPRNIKPNEKGEYWFTDLQEIYRKIEFFTEEMGKSVKEFVDNYKDKVKTIVVNCGAGISRSAGIACALDLYLNKKDSISGNPLYKPNSLAKSTLLRVFELTPR